MLCGRLPVFPIGEQESFCGTGGRDSISEQSLLNNENIQSLRVELLIIVFFQNMCRCVCVSKWSISNNGSRMIHFFGSITAPISAHPHLSSWIIIVIFWCPNNHRLKTLPGHSEHAAARPCARFGKSSRRMLSSWSWCSPKGYAAGIAPRKSENKLQGQQQFTYV